MRLKSLAAMALIGVLAGCGASGGSPRFAAGLPKVQASAQEARLEREMFERLNRDRAARGLPALVYDDRLADIARFHSQDMRDHGFFGHDSPTTGSPQDRIDRAGVLVMESRENVAQAPDVTIAQDQLLASPGHYANIVSTTVTHVGIGIVRDKQVPGQVRGYYFTQLFAQPLSEESLDQARAAVLEKLGQARKEAGQPALGMHPLLERFAKEHVNEVDPNDPGRSLGRIGDQAVEVLSKARDHDLRSVEAAAQVGLTGEMLQPEKLLDGGVRAVGFALAKDKDASGKPVVKMLFIVGR